VPRRLGRICLRALAAEPEGRQATAEDLAGDLERFLARRRRLAALGALAAVVLAAVAAWSLWRPHPPAPPAVPPKILAMQVELYRRDPPVDLGAIGTAAFAGRDGDDVRVRARLDAPAYCYLIALNPDGKDQLCSPPDENRPPPQSSEVNYPPDPTEGFGLTDGVGLQSFVLLASREPLPPYRAWRSRFGALPWHATEAGRGWRYDGRDFVPLEGERGEIRKPTGLPGPFAAACRALQSRPGVAAIRAVAFPVRPGQEERAPPPSRTEEHPR
jgi:hypothetical protein